MWELPGALAPMAAYRQFIVCRFVPHPTKPGKMNKFPVHPVSGEVCNAHDPAIWLDADTAGALAAAFGEDHGAGFVFTAADPFWFIDIDNCAEGNTWSELALHLCAAFAGCAIEVSQSGRGLHLFGTGIAPPHASRNDARGLEFYTEGRFVAFGSGATGDAGRDCTPALAWLTEHFFPPRDAAEHDDEWRTEPVAEWSGPADDDELIARMLASRQSAAAAFGGRAGFRDLWEGNAQALGASFPDSGGRPYDASAADAALASHLAYFTGNHHERIERLMRRSALAREKWDKHGSYLTNTITYCCARTSRWFNDGARPVAAAEGLTFSAAAAGAIPATLTNLQQALRSAESGVTLALDRFRDRLVLKAGLEWVSFGDVDYVKLRLAFEQRGFKSVGADLMRDAVMVVAAENAFDSAVDWGNSLAWDGVPRIEQSMSRYFGAEDNAYTRAVGRYLFTALAGRLMEPGCQADMALIFVGRQGTGKTSGIAALAPSPETFGEIDLAKIDDDNTARKLRGKLVIELAELKGLASKEDEAIKAWVSRRTEEWTPKFKEFETVFKRRCVLLGTANRRELLTDPTGNRRWLPIKAAGDVDVDAIRRDRDQLWAEGIDLWRKGGIQWREAQRLAAAEHDEFTQEDSWREEIEAWLNSPVPPRPGEVPLPTPRGQYKFAMRELLIGALRLDATRCGRREELRAANVLRTLGYDNGTVTGNDGQRVKRWWKRF